MLSIFICEDDLLQRKRLEKIIEDYAKTEEIELTIILSTERPHDILDYLKENPEISGLYFLDVDLNCEMDGIGLASEIRKIDDAGKIVFVTVSSGLAPVIFEHKIVALDYIIKGRGSEELGREVGHCIQVTRERQLEVQGSKQQFFKVKLGSRTQLIPFHEIMFFESCNVNGRINIHLKNGQMQVRGTLREIANKESFLRIHNKVVVNKENIKRIDKVKREIELSNGEISMVSVRGMKLLEKTVKLIDESERKSKEEQLLMKKVLFESELKVLEILWDEGDMIAKDLTERLKASIGWEVTTTYTVVNRCVKKGLIERRGNNFMCHPMITREEAQRQESEILVHKMFGGSSNQLVASLLGDSSMTMEQIEQLRKLVQESAS